METGRAWQDSEKAQDDEGKDGGGQRDASRRVKKKGGVGFLQCLKKPV